MIRISVKDAARDLCSGFLPNPIRLRPLDCGIRSNSARIRASSSCLIPLTIAPMFRNFPATIFAMCRSSGRSVSSQYCSVSLLLPSLCDRPASCLNSDPDHGRMMLICALGCLPVVSCSDSPVPPLLIVAMSAFFLPAWKESMSTVRLDTVVFPCTCPTFDGPPSSWSICSIGLFNFGNMRFTSGMNRDTSTSPLLLYATNIDTDLPFLSNCLARSIPCRNLKS